MQINERVWRGFYDQQRLRWDIDYNSAAGAEVLVDYLVKHALRKGEHRQPGGVANLARASYSAYNGGPSQVSRYRSNTASAYGRKVDEAFWEKYQQVAAGNELAVSGCLGGDLRGPVAAAAAPRRGEGDTARRGAPPADHFTLQLGAFSSEQAARSFISQRSIGDRARVHRRGDGPSGQFLVLYGDFATRGQAEAARKSIAGVDAWIRRVGDL
jgi:septal ring-binding cell division protein DamX